MQKPVRFKKKKKKKKKKLKKKLRKREFEINKTEFEESTRYIHNNQDNNDFKIVMNKRTYDLKNAKKFWMEVTTHKITKSEAK